MRLYQKLPVALLLPCILLGVLFTLRGLHTLGVKDAAPMDLSLRWREVQYVMAKGVNPYDISDHLYREKHGLAVNGAPPAIDPSLGGTYIASGYPPWAFPWSALAIPPVEWGMARMWFFTINLLALAFLAVFAWRTGDQKSRLGRLLPTVAIFSCSATGTTLGNGQWGIILCALLAASLWAAKRGKILLPAVAFAFTLLKPTFVFAHTAAFLRKKSLWPIPLIAGVLTLGAWQWTNRKVDAAPFEMISQMLEQTKRWDDYSYSIPDFLGFLGMPATFANLGCLVAGLLLASWILQERDGDMLFDLAVCGTLSRLFAYHQMYDNVLMVFLALAVIRRAFQGETVLGAIVMVAMLGSLWLPGRFTHDTAIQIMQFGIWIGALVWLVKTKPDGSMRMTGTDEPAGEHMGAAGVMVTGASERLHIGSN